MNRDGLIQAFREMNTPFASEAAASLAAEIHGRNVARGWWTDIDTGKPKARNVGELLMLSLTEINEALEGKDILDDHLPQYVMWEVEVADYMIRIFDLCGAYAKQAGTHIFAYEPPSYMDRTALLLGVFPYLCRAMEASRKGRPMDEHLGGALGVVLYFWQRGFLPNLPEAFADKILYNAVRADHAIEARQGADGKKT